MWRLILNPQCPSLNGGERELGCERGLILRAKDLRKKVPILQKGGFIPASLTLLAIRVVLLQTLYGVSNPLIPQLYMLSKMVFSGTPPPPSLSTWFMDVPLSAWKKLGISVQFSFCFMVLLRNS